MAEEQKQEKKVYICPVCVEREKEKGLQCGECRTEWKPTVRIALRKHEAVESELAYVIRRTGENLTNFAEERNDLMEITRPFFGEAHKEITAELRNAGVRLPKEELIGEVKIRCSEILTKAGLIKEDRRLQWLIEAIWNLEKQMRWLEKLDSKKRAEANAI